MPARDNKAQHAAVEVYEGTFSLCQQMDATLI